MQSENDIYQKLKERLKENHTWPSVFMFKFIVPDKPKKLAEVKALFGEEAIVSFHGSSKGKYVSITIKEVMLNENEVIEKYKKASKIEHLIAL
ncbi:MAG: DUF493 family protein [Bacteroidales bacterium]|nr:DUF493 family protein [Bacteroidales bacterium]